MRVLSDGRHVSKSSRIKPAYLIAGGVVVVAAVVLGFVLLGGGGGSLPIIGGSPPPPTPEFAFTMTKVTPVATGCREHAEDSRPRRRRPPDRGHRRRWTRCTSARSSIPAIGSTGSYDSVWELFESGASTEAQSQVETLTAGASAGDAFEQILPDDGQAEDEGAVRPKEQPFSVVAITTVRGRGDRQGRQDDVRMTSQGQFVFQQVDGDWRVVSFKVLRNNEVEAEPVAEREPRRGAPS